MKMNSEEKKRLLSEQKAMGPITNKDLVCKDCLFKIDDTVRLGNTSICEKFDCKPNGVLKGGECIEYVKE